MLKLAVNWKPQSLTNLIEKIFSLVQAQYKDIERSLIGRGNYVLAKNYSHYYIKPELWCSKSKEERKKFFLNFLKDRKKKVTGKYVKSTDGQLTVPTTSTGGKKPGQKKRKRSERTISIKKQKFNN